MDEKTSFVMVFGVSPVVKVIDFLIDNQEFDYSLTDITRGADIGWSTLHQFWPNLVKLKMVKKTRRIGRAELYKLNLENPIVKKLIEIDIVISEQMIRKDMTSKLSGIVGVLSPEEADKLESNVKDLRRRMRKSVNRTAAGIA